MSSHPRPTNLEELRSQARSLLRSQRGGDPRALDRIEAALPGRLAAGTVFRLAHALAVVAREHGFRSWPALKAAAASSAGGPKRDRIRPSQQRARAREIADIFLAAATDRSPEALISHHGDGRTMSLAVRDLLAEEGTLALVVDTLLLGVEHPNPRVRADSAHRMDLFADERCAPALVQLLDDPVPRVRRFAIHSLACEECKVTPFAPGIDVTARIIDLATADPSVQVRRHAVSALALCGDARAIEALEALEEAERDRTVLRNARWALRRLRAASR